MHNAAFGALGLDYAYLPFRVRREKLGEAVAGMRALNLRGLNVTIPHKVAVMPLLDEIDPLAGKIGAVNTIVNDEGWLRGYNTDAEGFLRVLLEAGISPEGKKVVVLGAGGASRAITFILLEKGARLTIINRQLRFDWAPPPVKLMELNEASLATALGEADILVNATSVGMSPHDAFSPVPAGMLRAGLVVYDIVYNPLHTRLLKEAEAAGARVIAGLDMLVGQGALAFEKWTGQAAPAALMKRAALEALGL